MGCRSTKVKEQPAPKEVDKNRSQNSDESDDSDDDDSHRKKRQNRSKHGRRKNAKQRKGRKKRGEYSSSDYSSGSEDDDNSPSRNRKYQKTTPSKDAYLLNGSEYALDKGRLQQIADDMLAHPPQPLTHSKSYNSSAQKYDEELKSALTEEYLDSAFEAEVEKLQSTALIRPYKVAKHRTTIADNEQTTKLTQISEYRLQLSALVNCYLKRRQELIDIRSQKEQQRNEDLLFLTNLKSRIKTEQLEHSDVVRHLDNYVQRSD